MLQSSSDRKRTELAKSTQRRSCRPSSHWITATATRPATGNSQLRRLVVCQRRSGSGDPGNRRMRRPDHSAARRVRRHPVDVGGGELPAAPGPGRDKEPVRVMARMARAGRRAQCEQHDILELCMGHRAAEFWSKQDFLTVPLSQVFSLESRNAKSMSKEKCNSTENMFLRRISKIKRKQPLDTWFCAALRLHRVSVCVSFYEPSDSPKYAQQQCSAQFSKGNEASAWAQLGRA